MTDPRCGTHSGYEAHRRAKTPPCPPCKSAKSAYNVEQRRRRRARAAGEYVPPRRPPAPPPATLRPGDVSWMEDATCAQVGPLDHAFFPDRGRTPSQALELCQACPVRAQCLAFGLDEPHGIWGGVSERGRRKITGKVA